MHRKISSKLHRAGTQGSLDTSDWIAQQYRNYGFDLVEQPEYNVLLSYPNDTDTNKVRLNRLASMKIIFSNRYGLLTVMEKKPWRRMD